MADRNSGLIAVAAVIGLVVGGGATYLAMSGIVTGVPPAGQAPATSGTASKDAPAPDDVVVARVNGTPVYRSELMKAFGQLPPQAQQMGMETLYPMLLDRVINTELLKEEAAKKIEPDNPEVAKQLAELRDQVQVQVYFQGQVDQRLTEEKIQARYQKFLEANPPQEEVRARHILVETEEKAKDILSKLQGGADFAESAKEFSTGPSGPSGGDLGYFTKEQMVEPFSNAAFALQPGEISPEPVKTQFGWHLIKVEDRRSKEPPSLDEMRDQFKDELTRDIVNEMLADLAAKADIEKFDIDGNPLPAEDAAGGQPAQSEQPAQPEQSSQPQQK